MAKNSAMAAPIDYDFESAFSYARWTEDTVLSLVNVNWNSDYRDIVRFSNQGALDTWINGHNPRTIDKMSLLKMGQAIRVNLPLNLAMQYNYARAANPVMPISGDLQQNYYYFVQEYRYVAPNTTELVVQLDVWQTFGYKVTFGQCYVERGHIGIANTNAFSDYGRDYLTVPEGMDVGSEYRTVHVESTPIVTPSDPNAYSILVCSTTELSVDPGTTASPILTTAFGSVIQGIPSGASFYVFQSANDFIKFMAIMATRPWATEGIVSVTVIPHITRYHPTWTPGTNLAPLGIAYVAPGTTADGADVSNPNGTAYYAPPATGPSGHIVQNMTNWRNASFVNAILGSRYDILKKFLTYPYCIIELTTFTGSPVVLKPESWQDGDATIVEAAALVPPGQRVVFYPRNYNSDPEAPATNGTSFSNDDLGDFINTSVALDNFPQMPVVNNMAIAFLANNKNGIAFAYSSADWSQQKALHGAQATSDIADYEIANRARQSGISNTLTSNVAANNANTAMQNTYNDLMTSVATAGLSNGTPIAGVVGAARDGFNQVNNQNNALMNAQQQITARGEGAISSNTLAGQTRDTNVGLARYSAKGDYANAVAAENAKVNDAKMTQPSTSGQFGGDAFNLINGIYGYSLRFKMLNVNAMKKIGDYWLRYGYAIGQFVHFPANYMVMSKFTYWKLSESYITSGAIPENFKQTIRGIFEKGVTVWASPDYIGTTDLADNTPLTGVSY